MWKIQRGFQTPLETPLGTPLHMGYKRKKEQEKLVYKSREVVSTTGARPQH